MTKWQESCITALASSPMAWEAFKMKQRNKKLLWQYVNRIWPYKLITGTKVNKNKKDLLAIAKILKIYHLKFNIMFQVQKEHTVQKTLIFDLIRQTGSVLKILYRKKIANIKEQLEEHIVAITYFLQITFAQMMIILKVGVCLEAIVI